MHQAEGEWTGVSEIVQLSFKAACHVLKAQSECIREMEQILPAKANKNEVATQLNAKANLIDVQTTMAEVAANIESKTSIEEFRTALEEKVGRLDFSTRLQDKVSFEDMKRYVTLSGGGATNTGNGGSPDHGASGSMANRQFELIDEELRKLKDKVEDTYHQMQSLR